MKHSKTYWQATTNITVIANPMEHCLLPFWLCSLTFVCHQFYWCFIPASVPGGLRGSRRCSGRTHEPLSSCNKWGKSWSCKSQFASTRGITKGGNKVMSLVIGATSLLNKLVSNFHIKSPSHVSVSLWCKVIVRLHNFLHSTSIEVVCLVNYENLPGTGNSVLIAY